MKPARFRKFVTSTLPTTAFISVSIAVITPAGATDAFWNGTSNGIWADDTNWSATPVPGSGEMATFDTAGNGNTTLDLGIGVAIKSIQFSTESAAAYSIGSGAVGSETLTLEGSGFITMDSAVENDQLINAAVTLGADAVAAGFTFTNDSLTNVLTFAGDIAGGSGGTAGTKTLYVRGLGNSVISGNLSTGGAAGLTFVKSGTGSVEVSGANTYAGGTRVNQGTAIMSGSLAGGAFLSINNVGAQNAVVKIVSGADLKFGDIQVGETADTRGAIYQSGGDLASTRASGTVSFRVGGGGTGSYGYYNLSGGSLTSNELGVGGAGASNTGVLDMSGGTMTVGSAGYITLARGSGTSSGLLNVTGGTVSAKLIVNSWGNAVGSLSVVNVGGGSSDASVTTTGGASVGVELTVSATAGITSALNLLNNGTLNTGVFRGGLNASTGLMNFDGGIIKATTTNAGANFLNTTNIDAVTVFTGGGTIDNNGTVITVGNALLGASGSGIASIAVADGGSGYIGAPMVKVTDGTGNAATAYAKLTDDGTGKGTFKIDSIVISSRGSYSVDPATVTLTGGGAATAATLGAIATSANVSGGMNFTGAGRTNLSGVNTYTGNTTVDGATTLVVAGSGAVTVKPTTDGVSSKVTGGGVVSFDGALRIDLTEAAVADGNSWTLVDVASPTYTDVSFAVSSATLGNFTEQGDDVTHVLSSGNNTWTFSETTGKLTLAVTSGGGYGSWITGFGLAVADQDPTDDPDNDGVENIVEYALGRNPSVPEGSASNAVKNGANLELTFERSDLAETNGDVSIIVEYGDDLIAWTAVAVPATSGTVSGVAFTITDGTPDDKVLATIPDGGSDRYFARVKVVK